MSNRFLAFFKRSLKENKHFLGAQLLLDLSELAAFSPATQTGSSVLPDVINQF